MADLERLRGLFDQVAAELAPMPADQQRAWLVGLLVRLDQGQDDYEGSLADLEAVIRERRALGRWPQRSTRGAWGAALRSAPEDAGETGEYT